MLYSCLSSYSNEAPNTQLFDICTTNYDDCVELWNVFSFQLMPRTLGCYCFANKVKFREHKYGEEHCCEICEKILLDGTGTVPLGEIFKAIKCWDKTLSIIIASNQLSTLNSVFNSFFFVRLYFVRSVACGTLFTVTLLTQSRMA